MVSTDVNARLTGLKHLDVRSVPLATDPHSNLSTCTVVGSTGLLAHVERTVQTACTMIPQSRDRNASEGLSNRVRP